MQESCAPGESYLRTDLNKLSGLKLQLDKEEKQSAGLKHKLECLESYTSTKKLVLEKSEVHHRPLLETTMGISHPLPGQQERLEGPSRYLVAVCEIFQPQTRENFGLVCAYQGKS